MPLFYGSQHFPISLNFGEDIQENEPAPHFINIIFV